MQKSPEAHEIEVGPSVEASTGVGPLHAPPLYEITLPPQAAVAVGPVPHSAAPPATRKPSSGHDTSPTKEPRSMVVGPLPAIAWRVMMHPASSREALARSVRARTEH